MHIGSKNKCRTCMTRSYDKNETPPILNTELKKGFRDNNLKIFKSLCCVKQSCIKCQQDIRIDEENFINCRDASTWKYLYNHIII